MTNLITKSDLSKLPPWMKFPDVEKENDYLIELSYIDTRTDKDVYLYANIEDFKAWAEKNKLHFFTNEEGDYVCCPIDEWESEFSSIVDVYNFLIEKGEIK